MRIEAASSQGQGPGSPIPSADPVVQGPLWSGPDWAAMPMAASWSQYVIDAFERGVLLLDVLRRRAYEQRSMASQPMATVLRFDHELVLSGQALARPINYALLRILPLTGVPTDARKRPVVVVDPRAGQGPGIGGFKPDSEIGDALRAGHPVYFIGFSAQPHPGQTFLDVVEGQVRFFEYVAERHPHAARAFAIGNCQAGYQTLMVAMLRPDLFGPCLVPGSPMSFWQGVHGRNPMRYAGGLMGGSWLTAMTSDLAGGQFDGTWLVLNFDMLGPANWLWGKQYQIFSHIDTDAERYLQFERWWGNFISLNGDELQYLVDNMFIGDKLTRNQLQSSSGLTFDVRNITSPIIVFASLGDNISPPPQSLGWILDLYRDTSEICASGRTIVYCLEQTIGHLAIFVSTKVGAKDDEEFVQLMDVIDCLPPGLYELVISARPANVPISVFVPGAWMARIESRTLDDIHALGRNSVEDDRAFAAVARLSELNLAFYRTVLQPGIRALASRSGTELQRALNPLRLSYTMFSDAHPWMQHVQTWAEEVAAARRPVAADNPFLELQAQGSAAIERALDAYRAWRDQLQEQVFFGFFGDPTVQTILGVGPDRDIRPAPSTSPESLAARRAFAQACVAKLTSGDFDEAVTRAVLYVLWAEHGVDQRCGLALNIARQKCMHLSLPKFKLMVREQFFLLQLEPRVSVQALAVMVPGIDARRKLLQLVREIVGACCVMNAPDDERTLNLLTILELAGEPDQAGASPTWKAAPGAGPPRDVVPVLS